MAHDIKRPMRAWLCLSPIVVTLESLHPLLRVTNAFKLPAEEFGLLRDLEAEEPLSSRLYVVMHRLFGGCSGSLS